MLYLGLYALELRGKKEALAYVFSLETFENSISNESLLVFLYLIFISFNK